MKILMTSVRFYPSIGGIQLMTEFLAEEFIRQGHEVKIITRTTEVGEKDFPFEVIRNPSTVDLFRAYFWCDVFVHQSISLYWTLPAFLFLKPWFIVYHQAYLPPGISGYLKRFCAFFAHNICVSQTVADGNNLRHAKVILNGFDSTRYKNENKNLRRDFLFVGTLIYTKGLHLLIDAFTIFKDKTQSDWKLTIIGDAEYNFPQRDDILINAGLSKYSDDIIFNGYMNAQSINAVQQNTLVQIVPSLDKEAFGLVVLEGMAAGCMLIGSDKCGIAEAMGDAGFSFERGNVDALADMMVRLYKTTQSEYDQYVAKAQKHVEQQSLRNVAMRYIEHFKSKL